MKRYKVFLTRDYIVEINAKNEMEAKKYSEFFVSGGIDGSTKKDQRKYRFKINLIESVNNSAFEVKEL